MHQPGIKPGSRPWQGRIISLYYWCVRSELSIPRLELGTSRVLGERHDQLDHTDLSVSGVSGFRSQYLDLAKVARFRLRQYPITGLWSIWVSIPVPRPCEGRTLPIAPIPHGAAFDARAVRSSKGLEFRKTVSRKGWSLDRKKKKLYTVLPPWDSNPRPQD